MGPVRTTVLLQAHQGVRSASLAKGLLQGVATAGNGSIGKARTGGWFGFQRGADGKPGFRPGSLPPIPPEVLDLRFATVVAEGPRVEVVDRLRSVDISGFPGPFMFHTCDDCIRILGIRGGNPRDPMLILLWYLFKVFSCFRGKITMKQHHGNIGEDFGEDHPLQADQSTWGDSTLQTDPHLFAVEPEKKEAYRWAVTM